MLKKLFDQQDPFGYNAQYGYFRDRETGLYLCTYRYYDPATGRFLNLDPVGYDWTINLYGYCQNNPLSFIDPLGLWGLYRWIYTGDGNASDEVYEAALDGAAAGFRTGVAGATDGLTGGAIVNPSQTDEMGYETSRKLGAIAGFCLDLAGGLKENGINGEFRRYPSGGGGLRITKNGDRVGGVDVHPWERGGETVPWYQWPHYHRRPPGGGEGSGIGNHRPWQGGW